MCDCSQRQTKIAVQKYGPWSNTFYSRLTLTDGVSIQWWSVFGSQFIKTQLMPIHVLSLVVSKSGINIMLSAMRVTRVLALRSHALLAYIIARVRFHVVSLLFGWSSAAPRPGPAGTSTTSTIILYCCFYHNNNSSTDVDEVAYHFHCYYYFYRYYSRTLLSLLLLHTACTTAIRDSDARWHHALYLKVRMRSVLHGWPR